MIISKRMKIPRRNSESAHLLDYVLEYFRNNVSGEVLRFAIVETRGKDLIVDASIRINAPQRD